MTPAERVLFKKWLKGIPYEISFWKSYYSHRKSLATLDSWSEYGKECCLDNFDITQFVEGLTHTPVLVDLGCALSYAFGTEFGGREVTIDRIDPLAVFYNRILDRYAPERPHIQFGMIECLSATYTPESADLIHVRNALDHCADPMAGIRQCLACLRPGGVLYLNHHRNEALREGYRGFHQYNIDLRDSRLIIWNREKTIDPAEELKDLADVKAYVADNGYIVGVITKKTQFRMATHAETSEATQRFEDTFNLLMESVNSFGFCFKYQWARLVTAIGHPLMRRIPRGMVASIKKALSSKK